MSPRITSGHGSGGKMMRDLIETIIRPRFGPDTQTADDAAIIEARGLPLAFTTDSYTITPIFFPGGDIGSLAVNGTVNDLAVMGAAPIALSCALILEEGFVMEDLIRILDSMKAAAAAADVRIVTGDTKVVPHGKGDGVFINTSGIGIFETTVQRRPIAPGDRIIVSGFIGDHGMAIMAIRHNLSFAKGLVSDCANLNHMIRRVTDRFPDQVKFMRDPTRGGVATVCNEIAEGMPWGVKIVEQDLPIREEVKGVGGILGIDPLYAANEGKVLLVASPESADGIVEILRASPEGRDAAIIGEITPEFPGRAWLATRVGGRRLLPLLTEEQLPRIC